MSWGCILVGYYFNFKFSQLALSTYIGLPTFYAITLVLIMMVFETWNFYMKYEQCKLD